MSALVWRDVHDGEPYPQAGPGERLVIVRWMLPEEELAAATGSN